MLISWCATSHDVGVAGRYLPRYQHGRRRWILWRTLPFLQFLFENNFYGIWHKRGPLCPPFSVKHRLRRKHTISYTILISLQQIQLSTKSLISPFKRIQRHRELSSAEQKLLFLRRCSSTRKSFNSLPFSLSTFSNSTSLSLPLEIFSLTFCNSPNRKRALSEISSALMDPDVVEIPPFAIARKVRCPNKAVVFYCNSSLLA